MHCLALAHSNFNNISNDNLMIKIMLKGALKPRVKGVEQCDLFQDKTVLNFDDDREEVFEYPRRLLNVASRISASKLFVAKIFFGQKIFSGHGQSY
jgi:hypothetical protein